MAGKLTRDIRIDFTLCPSIEVMECSLVPLNVYLFDSASDQLSVLCDNELSELIFGESGILIESEV